MDKLLRKTLAVMQQKGGSGKTTILTNLATTAALKGWTVVVVDMDTTATLSSVAQLRRRDDDVQEALIRTANGDSVDDLLQYSTAIGAFVLRSNGTATPSDLYAYIPDLVQSLQNSYLQKPDSSEVKTPDLVIVDTGGGAQGIVKAVLPACDYVLIPVLVRKTDAHGHILTIKMLTEAQQVYGKPELLGVLPNNLQRGGAIEKKMYDALAQSGTLLPFIPASEALKGQGARVSESGATAGMSTAVGVAPNSAIGKRFFCLFDILNGDIVADYEEVVKEAHDYLKISSSQDESI